MLRPPNWPTKIRQLAAFAQATELGLHLLRLRTNTKIDINYALHVLSSWLFALIRCINQKMAHTLTDLVAAWGLQVQPSRSCTLFFVEPQELAAQFGTCDKLKIVAASGCNCDCDWKCQHFAGKRLSENFARFFHLSGACSWPFGRRKSFAILPYIKNY